MTNILKNIGKSIYCPIPGPYLMANLANAHHILVKDALFLFVCHMMVDLKVNLLCRQLLARKMSGNYVLKNVSKLCPEKYASENVLKNVLEKRLGNYRPKVFA